MKKKFTIWEKCIVLLNPCIIVLLKIFISHPETATWRTPRLSQSLWTKNWPDIMSWMTVEKRRWDPYYELNFYCLTWSRVHNRPWMIFPFDSLTKGIIYEKPLPPLPWADQSVVCETWYDKSCCSWVKAQSVSCLSRKENKWSTDTWAAGDPEQAEAQLVRVGWTGDSSHFHTSGDNLVLLLWTIEKQTIQDKYDPRRIAY